MFLHMNATFKGFILILDCKINLNKLKELITFSPNLQSTYFKHSSQEINQEQRRTEGELKDCRLTGDAVWRNGETLGCWYSQGYSWASTVSLIIQSMGESSHLAWFLTGVSLNLASLGNLQEIHDSPYGLLLIHLLQFLNLSRFAFLS